MEEPFRAAAVDGEQAQASAWGIIGHAWAVGLLAQSLARGHLSHAYLLLGPPRVGKTTLALALARAINCVGEAPPCGRCRSCRLIEAGRHPDVRLLEGGEVRAIHIDEVRELRRQIALSPVEARRRVVILTDFQGATPEAANCLLKTLEEPAGQVMLVLTATQEGRLLPTIVSRCQRLSLRAPADDVIARGLEAKLGLAPELASRLARLAGGRVGWAIEAALDPGGSHIWEQQLDCIRQIVAADTLGRLQWARDLSADVDRLPSLLDSWSSWWRGLLLRQAGCGELAAAVGAQAAEGPAAGPYSVAELAAGLRALGEARWRLERNANPRLTLEVLFLAM